MNKNETKKIFMFSRFRGVRSKYSLMLIVYRTASLKVPLEIERPIKLLTVYPMLLKHSGAYIRIR